MEDLIAAGDDEAAISFLESLVSKLETRFNDFSEPLIGLQLASALTELANLCSSKGFSIKSEELFSRASEVKQCATQLSASRDENLETCGKGDQVASGSKDSSYNASLINEGNIEKGFTKAPDGDGLGNASSEDDWEAIADREPNELLSSQCLPDLSSLSLKDTEDEGPKKRGRGTFSYKKNELYSDRQSDDSILEDDEHQDEPADSERMKESINSKYGTRHVLVLADFLPSMRTVDVEKLFKDFNVQGFVIRWVNDTTALAVFRTPTSALEACNRVRCPFTVRVLGEDDVLLGSISERDLEPPRQRPQTSARTAQRLIAQGMGLKLPVSTSESKEFKNQEEARRNRITTRQKLRDDAWGAD